MPRYRLKMTRIMTVVQFVELEELSPDLVRANLQRKMLDAFTVAEVSGTVESDKIEIDTVRRVLKDD